MELETTTGDAVELETPVTEWVQLTDDPFNADGLVLCDAGATFLLVRMNPVLGPVEVVESGSELRAFTEYDRDGLDAKLATDFSDLTDDQRTALLDWYADLVSELIELDLYDPDFQTTFVEGTAYIEGVHQQVLEDEIVSILDDRERTIAPDIAVQVNDWWSPDDDAPIDLAGTNAYAARIDLIG